MPNAQIGNPLNRSLRESVPGGGGAWKLLYFMSFVFFVFLLTYVGLTFGYKNFLMARIDTVSHDIEALAATNPAPGKQDEFLAFQSQLISLKGILDKRQSPLKVLTLLETHTNADVYYTNFSLSVPERRLEVQGVAPSYDVLAGQLQAYGAMKEVQRYEVGNARVKEGGKVSFSAILYMDPSAILL